MITPEYLNEIMYKLEDDLAGLNDYMIKQIASRIIEAFTVGDELLAPSRLADIKRLMANGVVYEDIIKAVEKELPTIRKEVRKAFYEASEEIARQNQGFAKKLVLSEKMASIDVPEFPQVGITEHAVKLSMTPYEIRLLEQAYKRTIGEIKNYTSTTAQIAQKDYFEACNNAWMKAQSGVSLHKAVAEAVKEVSGKGVRCVTYDSGHSDRMEVAIARAVRTGINQANSSIVLQRCAEMGVGFVQVSAHLGARVTNADDYTNHSWWQGKVYSIDWSLPEFNQYKPSVQTSDEEFEWLAKMREYVQSKNVKNKYPDFVETCGYGDIQGIIGANCRHSFYPFYPDVMMDSANKIDSEENQKRYEAEQKARYMERKMREMRREIEALKQGGDEFKEEISAKNRKLKLAGEKYADFCKENGLKPRNIVIH